MKKLIALFAALSSIAAAQVTTELTAGYRSKDFSFGKVASTVSAYTTTADIRINSFRLGTSVQDQLTLKSSKLYQLDLIGGYKFFSSLADVEFGTRYVTKGIFAKYDMKNHWRPFVEVSKGIFSVRSQMDLEAKTSNIEGALKRALPLGAGFKFTPSVYVGYTDANDALPHTIKEIKYTNVYYGGSGDVSWKWATAGLYTIHTKIDKKYTNGYRAGVALKF
jgi:hypothetical protein